MNMQKIVCAITIALATAGAAASGVLANPTIRIIAFNDLHGNLQSPGNFGTQPGGSGTATISKASGGADYFAGYVNSLKAGYPNSVVVSDRKSVV